MKDIKKIFLLIFPFWKKYWKNELLLLVVLIASFSISLILPLKFKIVVDTLTGNYLDSTFETALLLFASLIFLKSLIGWFYAVYITTVGESFIIDITSKVYDSVLHKQRSFWIKFYPNDVLTRLTQDIISVKSFLFDFLHNVFFQGISILGIISVLYYLSPKIGLLVTIQVLIIFVVTYFGSGFLSKRAVVLRQIASKFTHIFQTGIAQPFLNFSWNLFQYHHDRYLVNAHKMRKEQISFVNQIQQINQGIGFINLLIGTIALYFLLRSDYNAGLISIGGIFATIMYSGSAIQSATSLASNVVSTKLNRVSIIRINEIINYESDVIGYIKHNEILCHPFFNYELKEGFIIPEGDKFLFKLSTSNGSGKSTLAQVLSGFDELNGKTAKEKWFILPSDLTVFEGTLLDNIKIISCKEVDSQSVNQIIRDNKLGDLLRLFPDGLSTQILTNTEMISRGQKQAVMLISAVIKDPDKIIIDEGLNSLDKEIKTNIKEPLKDWLCNRKTIFIDHENMLSNETAAVTEFVN